MLRRLKKEVEKSLPPKEETILFTSELSRQSVTRPTVPSGCALFRFTPRWYSRVRAVLLGIYCLQPNRKEGEIYLVGKV